MILLGDCFDLMPAISADFIFTSPPYNNHVRYGESPLPFENTSSYKIWLTDWFALARACAKGGLIVVHQRSFEEMVRVVADQVVRLEKPFPEYVYIYGDVRYPDSSIRVRPTRDEHHPCPFSEEMVRYFLSPLPRKASILDPFAGLGTTVKVARELGFTDARGIEKEAQYIAQGAV